MSCLFVHDFRSYQKDGVMYTVNMSYDIFRERYIKYFDSIRVINRCGKLGRDDSNDKYVICSGENIDFVDAVDIFTPVSFAINYGKIKKSVNHYIDKSDYVIIRLDSFLGLIAAKRCRKTGKKYLIEVVGCVWDSFWNKGAYGKLVAYPLFMLMKKEIQSAPYVVYVTESFLQERYPTDGKSINISNVLLPKHDDELLEQRLKRIEHVGEGPCHIVTVASVSVRYKGQESVIRALGELKKKGNADYIYHLIGGGDQSYLKKVAKNAGVDNQVVFHGVMKHDNIASFLDDCDIYIQPSKQEGLPRALIEGMSRGMLCYGTRVAGIPELLDSEMLFSKKNNNYREIAGLLENNNKEVYKSQAKRNFVVAQKYEMEILEQKRDRFFSEFRDS